MQEALEIIPKGIKRIQRELKEIKGIEAAERQGYDTSTMGRRKVAAAADLGRVERQADQAVQSGSSRDARDRAERKATLEGKLRLSGTIEIEFEARKNVNRWGGEHPGTHSVPGGCITVDFDEDRIIIEFDERMDRQTFREVVRGNGFKFSRRTGSVIRSNITENAVSSLRVVTGVNLYDYSGELWDIHKDKQRIADEAARKTQEATLERKRKAREGEGSLADIVDAAMRKRSKFKLPVSLRDKKKISPGVRKGFSWSGGGSFPYRLLYKSKEDVKSPYHGGMLTGRGVREVRIATFRKGNSYVASPYSPYQGSAEVDSERFVEIATQEEFKSLSNSEKAQKIINSYIELIKSYGSLESMTLTYYSDY
jgi:hypothetical protein